MNLLEGLNPQQHEAVLFEEGPLLVLAGAGSGKTRVITCRIVHLIRERGVSPDRILAVTFTNKAAQEMRERVISLLPDEVHARPTLSTFHSFCTRVLRRHADRLNHSRDFTIYDSDDQLRVMKGCLKDLEVPESILIPRKAVSLISLEKNSARTLGKGELFPGRRDADIYQKVFHLYTSRLRSADAMDFDDLLLNALVLFSRQEDIRNRFHDEVQHLLIDEYQDTNRLQYELICTLTGPSTQLCAVGDEDQSIYRFRGAHIGNITSFEKDFPGARVMKLEQNYRSTKRILEAASSVVSHNTERKDKTLWTKNEAGDLVRVLETQAGGEEAEAVARVILSLKSEESDRTFGVLYRTNFQSRYFEEVFRKEAIPFNLVGGVSFYARAEIKDVVAYLRLVRNPADEMALMRIINTPARGIGETTISRLKEHASAAGATLWDAAEAFAKDSELSGRAFRSVAAFVHLIHELRGEMSSLPLSELIEQVVVRSGYDEMLRNEDSPEAFARLANIDELANAAEEWEAEGLGVTEFLDRASLASDTDDYDARSHVTLMTLHSAKGLEFDVVFLVGMEEGLFPHVQSMNHPSDLEEERRLCYVGMTRARRRLFLSWSRHRRSFGTKLQAENVPSRFLAEIPKNLLEFIKDGYSSRESSWNSPFQAMPEVRRDRGAYAGRTYNTTESITAFLRSKGKGASVRAGRQKGVPKPPADPGGPNDFPPGTRVQHPKFGEGYVLEAAKEGAEIKLVIRFADFGRKRMIQRLSRLQKI